MWAHGWGRPVCQWSSSASGSRLAGSDPVGKVMVVVVQAFQKVSVMVHAHLDRRMSG